MHQKVIEELELTPRQLFQLHFITPQEQKQGQSETSVIPNLIKQHRRKRKS